jgi:uncharacterized protein YndB with AHSA1/START domain
MKNTLINDFVVDKANKTITVKREYEAPLSSVWDAYTKSEILDKWWAPKPWRAETKSMNFKEGGRWTYAMVGPEGEKHWAIADYTSIQPQKKFVVLDAFADENGNIKEDMPKSKWEADFTENGDKTLVEFKITYDDVSQLEQTIDMGFKEGLQSAMENLDELLEEETQRK